MQDTRHMPVLVMSISQAPLTTWTWYFPSSHAGPPLGLSRRIGHGPAATNLDERIRSGGIVRWLVRRLRKLHVAAAALLVPPPAFPIFAVSL
jgi:hypothetical protein